MLTNELSLTELPVLETMASRVLGIVIPFRMACVAVHGHVEVNIWLDVIQVGVVYGFIL